MIDVNQEHILKYNNNKYDTITKHKECQPINIYQHIGINKVIGWGPNLFISFFYIKPSSIFLRNLKARIDIDKTRAFF